MENQYGESVSPEKAPEAISKAVASLPPEQMFELMRQMKLCVQVDRLCHNGNWWSFLIFERHICCTFLFGDPGPRKNDWGVKL